MGFQRTTWWFGRFVRVVVITLCLVPRFGQSWNTKKPHIIIIQADDMGWNDVSFHGSNQIPTPNIDALAYNGLILNRHYVLPTCTPSRTAFMTGLYPIKTGMQGYPLIAGEARAIPLSLKIMPQYMKDLGYVTRLVGKWHLGYYTKFHTPTYRGFDSFFGYYNGYIGYHNHSVTQYDVTGYDLHRNVGSTLKTAKVDGYFTDVITKEATQIIETHDISQPLFLQVNHLAPHGLDGTEALEIRNETEMNNRFGYIQHRNRRRYASVVSSLDESVGKIVTSLKNTGMLDNSIILFMSDNGAQTEGLLENFGSNYPLRGLKFTLFEGGIRGVACLYSPLIKRTGRVVNQLIHVTDWLPTLYSAAGGNLNDLKDIDGVNQWRVLINPQINLRNFILLNIDEVANLEAALIDRFKLVKGAIKLYGQYYGDSGRSELNLEYNISEILNSETHIAIQTTFGSSLSEKRIKNLRSKSEVKCKKIQKYPSCAKYCLFDIESDPCESKDISSIYPRMTQILEAKLDEYRKYLISIPYVKKYDPASSPEYSGGYWMPWLECENCSNVCSKPINNKNVHPEL